MKTPSSGGTLMKAGNPHGLSRHARAIAACFALFAIVLLAGCRGASPTPVESATPTVPLPTREPTTAPSFSPTSTATPSPSIIIYKSIDLEEERPWIVSLSSNAKYIAVVTENETNIYELNYDPPELKKIIKLPVPGTKVLDIYISNDGQYVATVLNDIDVWNVSNGQKLYTLKMGEVRGVAFSPNSKILAATSCYSLKVWDLTTQKELISWIPEHKEGGRCTIGAHTPGVWLSDRMIAINRYEDVIIWYFDSDKGPISLELKGSRSVAISPDEQLIAISPGETIEIVGISNKEYRKTINVPNVSELWWATRLLFSPDGRLLAALDSDEKSLKIFDVENGNELHDLKDKIIIDLSFSYDGNFLVLATLKEKEKKVKIELLKTR
jgi:WD40 repeat protein